MVEPIVVQNLTKDFNGFRPLNGLSLVVKRSSFVGFLGPSGAGVSTAMKILTNLLFSTCGSAHLNGANLMKRPKLALSDVDAPVEAPEFYPYQTPKATLAYIGKIVSLSKEDIWHRTRRCRLW